MITLALALLIGLSTSDPQEFFREVWSPYCKGNSLQECPSSQAEILRNEVRERLQSGEDSEEILAELEERYGMPLRMQPEISGRGWLAYWLPWLTFGLCLLALVIYWLPRLKQNSANPEQKIASVSLPEDMQRDLQERLK